MFSEKTYLLKLFLHSASPEEAHKAKTIPHDRLDQIFKRTGEMLRDERFMHYLYRESVRVADDLEAIDEIKGVAGLGFPFYAVDRNGDSIEVCEIRDFITKIRKKVANDAKQNPEGWKVPSCTHSLGAPCTGCSSDILTPRDVAKTLPDLDIIVIAKNPTSETEKRVQEKLTQKGYVSSDTDLGTTLDRAEEVYTSVEKNKEPKEKIPVDIHIWSQDDFETCLDALQRGEKEVFITGRSLHADWENYRVNFWFDFVFSFTELGAFDPAIAKKIEETRRSIAERYSFEEIVTILSNSSARAERLMQCTDVLNVLRTRINSWK